MKQLTIIILATILLASLAAADLEVTSGLENSNLILDADYSRFTDDDQEHVGVTTSIQVKNTGNQNITLSGTFTLPNDYNASTIENIALEPNQTKSITVNVNIPHEEGPGDKNIGSLTLTGSDNSQVSVPLIQRTESMLLFKRITVDYTDENAKGQSDRFDPEDDDKFDLDDDVQVGTKIRIELQFENEFDNDYDDDFGTIEDITVTFDASSNDFFPDDFDDEHDLGDIEQGEKVELDLEFDINEDADDDDYTIEIKVEAQDGKGVDYEFTREIDLKLERQSHDLRVTNVQVSPSSIDRCAVSAINVDLEVENFGTKDQDFVKITLKNDQLDINEEVSDINLEDHSDSDNDWRRTFSFSIPKATSAGSYPIEARIFRDRTKLMDSQRVDLTITNCQTTTPSSDETTTDDSNDQTNDSDVTTSTSDSPTTTRTVDDTTVTTTVISQPQGDQGTPSDNQGVITSVEDGYTTSDIILAVLIVGIILVIALIALFFVILIRGK